MPSVFLLRRCQSSLRKAQDRLSQQAGWQLCGSSETLRGAGALIRPLAPDVVACDLRLLDGHASQLALQMRRWARRPQLLLLSPTADDPLLFNSLQAGASAYCVEAGIVGQQNLAPNLLALLAGRASMSPQIARACLAAFGVSRSTWACASQAPAGDADSVYSPATLSLTESHLLSLVSRGLLCPEIAQLWRCGPEFIEERLFRIYQKLHRHGGV